MAIQSNELRIGNKLNFGEVMVTIQGIHTQTIGAEDKRDYHFYVSDFVNFSNYYCVKPYQLDPIPLTAELLRGICFNKDDEGRFYYQPEFENIHYRLLEFPYGSWILSKGFINYNHELNTIKYLHQLQNWYYLLQNEELPITLK